MADLGLGRITWTCMVCGQERDDQDIAVATESAEVPRGRGGQMSVNVRFCADSATCAAQAREMAERWIARTKTEEEERVERRNKGR